VWGSRESREAIVAEFASVVDDADLITDPELIGRRLRDNSWLSPVLKTYIDDMAGESGRSLDVCALVSPVDAAQLQGCVSLLYRWGAPIVVLGAGTTNFGQTTPLDGGVVIEMKHFNLVDAPRDGRVSAGAGATTAAVDDVAHETDLEIPVMTTTFATATSGGWVSGGHIGLGSPTWGSIWDDNVVGATLMTVEEQPRMLSLDETAIEPVLHSYGTTGILTDVTFRLVEARQWTELVVCFEDFDAACRFTAAVSERPELRIRAAAAQEPSITPCFSALRGHVEPQEAIVISIIDDDQHDIYVTMAAEHGGRVVPWRGRGADHRPTLAYMVYGHRMLWVKKIAPLGAFLHCYLDPDDPLPQLATLKQRFGDEVMVELKFLRSRWLRERFGHTGEGVLPAPLVCVVEGEKDLAAVMSFCDEIGIRYQNPHTFFLDQKGLLRDPGVMKRFKADVDPKGLLNPGKFSDYEVSG
jgi:FAD/FMN-containing dehydrogenase